MAIKNVLMENPTEKREHIVFVGDTYTTDVIGANAAGIHVIWINHKGEMNTKELPVYSIPNTDKLAEMIKRIIE